MKESIVMVASYGGPYGGNFIPSLIAYDEVVKKLGYRTIYIFPDFVSDFAWVDDMRQVADKLYFIPYNQYSWDNIRRIRSICIQEYACLVYSRMGGWDITARLAMPRLPIIWHMELELNLQIHRNIMKYWVKYRLLGFGKTYHIAISEKTANDIDSFGVKNKCMWIPNAINLIRLRKRPEYQYRKPIHLLTFAYQPIIKGLDLAIDACEQLNQYNHKYVLMVSSQEKTYEYLKERYDEDLPEWIELLPPTNDIASLYNNTDIMLSPSRFEAFSYCLAEAIYSGIPVVYSDVPGTRWVDEMRMAVRFKSGDVDSLIEAIQTCSTIQVKELYQNINRDIIRNKYTMTTWNASINKCISEIIQRQEDGKTNG